MDVGVHRWVNVAPAHELRAGALRTFKHDRRQLVVGLDSEGRPFALDNACPHEGYPLATGKLDGGRLTCEWHNWKFDVHGGRCLLGGEDVRAYPCRVQDGVLQVELSDPDPDAQWPKLRASISAGLVDGSLDRVLRDAARLLAAGYEPVRLLVDVARQDARHAEYGATHVLAVCADARRLLAVRPGRKALHAIAPALELCLETNRRLPARRRPEPRPGADADSLLAAVEEERLDEAEALLRGALQDPGGRGRVHAWMYRLLGQHFLSFGHPLIYLVKLQELLRGIDDAEAIDELLGGLLHGLGNATREDRLPYWRPYREAFAEVEPELSRLWSEQDPQAPFDAPALRDAVLEGGARESVQAITHALEQGVPAVRIARALVQAGARRLGRFDVDLDRRPEVAENWLWATHRFTFASAVRNAVERFPSPHALRFLYQAGAFVHGGRAMDGRDRAVELEPAREDATAAEVLEAVRTGDVAAAIAGGRGCLKDLGESARLQLGLEEHVLADPYVRPILHAHAIKGVVAAWEEREAAEGSEHDEARDLPVLAMLRFLASPIVEKRVREQADGALRWVHDGERPRKLTQ